MKKNAMNSYDFSRINDKEFEDLVIDLLQAENPDCPIERFMAGRDGGIDGRFYHISDTVIIQCKQYVKSSYSSLLNSLKLEAPKVKALNPNRYILAICQDLTNKRKEEIIKIIGKEYLKSDDIITATDITHRISLNKSIERKYYKLWLNSTSVLFNLLHNDIIGKSLNFIEQIKENADKYVETQDLARAKKILEASDVIIITGDPGVGKTTLAEQICLAYILDGYQLILIEDDVSEGERVISPDSKQFFLYDDFLGRNYLDAIRNKEDSKIVRFINRIRRCENKKLVLTSRTTILNQGKATSEIFHINNTEKHEYEVELKNLDIIDKAKVLYSHLWLSELPIKYLDCIWEDKRYKKIVSHANYNPRLISFLTDYNKISHLPAESYWEHITNSLDNPSEIWHHMFTKQLPYNVYNLTYLVSLNNGMINEETLEESYENFLDITNYDRTQRSYIPFIECVRLSVKSTLQRKIDKNGTVTYDVLNPSVSDYLTNKINENQKIIPSYFSALTSIRSLHNLRNLSSKHLSERVVIQTVKCILQNINKKNSTQYIIELIQTIISNPKVDNESKINVAKLLGSSHLPFSEKNSNYDNDMTIILVWMLNNNCSWIDKDDLLNYLANSVANGVDVFNSEELTVLAQMAILLNDQNITIMLKNQLIEFWGEIIQDFIKDSNDFNSYYNPDESDNLHDEVKTYVKELLSESKLHFIDAEIESILDNFDPIDIIENNIQASSGWDYDNDDRPSGSNDYDAVDDIFHRE